MKKNKRWIQIVILAAIVVVGGYTIGSSLWDEKETKIVRVGDKAPNFSVEGLDGKTYRLSDYRGTTVVLNFWGSFCPPCVNEMPLLDDIYEANADHAVVLGVNLDEARLTVESFVRRTGVTFPILLDDETIQRMYGVIQYPTTFVIDAEGVITRKVESEITSPIQLGFAPLEGTAP